MKDNDAYLSALLKVIEAARHACAVSHIENLYHVGRLQGIYAGLLRAKELYDKAANDEIDQDDFK
jgi:hypothetical protein